MKISSETDNFDAKLNPEKTKKFLVGIIVLSILMRVAISLYLGNTVEIPRFYIWDNLVANHCSQCTDSSLELSVHFLFDLRL